VYPVESELQRLPGGHFNKTSRGLGEKIEKTDPREVGTGFKAFSEENTAGIQFKLAGVVKPGRTQLAIRKVYPKLAEVIYDKKKKLDLRNMKN